MTDDDHKSEDDLYIVIKSKEKRKIQLKRQKKKSAWYGFGLFGIIGWSISIPTLIGLSLGIYIDTHYPTPYLFSLMGLILGVTVGSWLAFIWIKKEQKEIEKDKKNQ